MQIQQVGEDYVDHHTASAGADATLTWTGETSKEHQINTIVGSFADAGRSGRLELICGGTTKFDIFIIDLLDLEFSKPIHCDPGQDITLTLYNASSKQCSVFLAGRIIEYDS